MANTKFGKIWRVQFEIHRTHLQIPWRLYPVSIAVVSLGMPLLGSKWQKTFNKNSWMSSSYSVLSSLVLDFSFSYFWTPSFFFSRTQVLDVQGTWKETVEVFQLAKAPLSTQAVTFLTDPWPFSLCMQATVLWHTIQWQSHLTGFCLPGVPPITSGLILPPKTKVQSPQLCWGHGATMRSGTGDWYGFEELQGEKCPWSTSQCSCRSSCCGATGTTKQNNTWERTKNYPSHPDTVRIKALGKSGTEQSQNH